MSVGITDSVNVLIHCLSVDCSHNLNSASHWSDRRWRCTFLTWSLFRYGRDWLFVGTGGSWEAAAWTRPGRWCRPVISPFYSKNFYIWGECLEYKKGTAICYSKYDFPSLVHAVLKYKLHFFFFQFSPVLFSAIFCLFSVFLLLNIQYSFLSNIYVSLQSIQDIGSLIK